MPNIISAPSPFLGNVICVLAIFTIALYYYKHIISVNVYRYFVELTHHDMVAVLVRVVGRLIS